MREVADWIAQASPTRAYEWAVYNTEDGKGYQTGDLFEAHPNRERMYRL